MQRKENRVFTLESGMFCKTLFFLGSWDMEAQGIIIIVSTIIPSLDILHLL